MLTTTQSSIRFIDIHSWSDLRAWWNKKIALRIKGIVYTMFVTGILIVGGQYQIAHANQVNLDRVCETRATGREDLRKVLYSIVDLSNLFPDGEPTDGAKAYTESRVLIIDTLIDPDDDREYCPT